MFDLETLGTIAGAPVMSIGASSFDPFEDYSTEFPDDLKLHYNNIDINSCLSAGMMPDGDTLMWWMSQGEEAVKALTDPKPVGLNAAVKQFKNYYWEVKNELPKDVPLYVWAHGLPFDPPMWDKACQAAGQRAPWLYWNLRDTRTLFGMAFGYDKKPTDASIGTKHNAMHDSLSQIVWVQEAHRLLNIDATSNVYWKE